MTDVIELNKRRVRLFVEAVWNEGRVEIVGELVADDYVGRVPWTQSGVLGPDGVRRLVSGRRRDHPGLQVKIDDQIAEDDTVVTRWRATSAPPAAADGGAPPGGAPCCAGISIIRLLAGKQVDSYTECSLLVPDAISGLVGETLPARR